MRAPTTSFYGPLADVYDDLVVDPIHGSWARFLDGLWEVDADGVRNVLDVCCGTGLMAAEVGKLGYRVTGVDGSADMLARARVRLGPAARLHRAWLPDLATEATFDAAIATLDSLNYLPEKEFQETVHAVAERLRGGGWFVFDLHTDALLRLVAGQPVQGGEHDGRRFVLHHDVDVFTRNCRTAIEYPDARGHSFREEHVQFFHSDALVGKALRAAGFRAITAVDEYSHDAVTDDTLRATWLARLA